MLSPDWLLTPAQWEAYHMAYNLSKHHRFPARARLSPNQKIYPAAIVWRVGSLTFEW